MSCIYEKSVKILQTPYVTKNIKPSWKYANWLLISWNAMFDGNRINNMEIV